MNLRDLKSGIDSITDDELRELVQELRSSIRTKPERKLPAKKAKKSPTIDVEFLSEALSEEELEKVKAALKE